MLTIPLDFGDEGDRSQVGDFDLLIFPVASALLRYSFNTLSFKSDNGYVENRFPICSLDVALWRWEAWDSVIAIGAIRHIYGGAVGSLPSNQSSDLKCVLFLSIYLCISTGYEPGSAQLALHIAHIIDTLRAFYI
jgi:hypothetical protein